MTLHVDEAVGKKTAPIQTPAQRSSSPEDWLQVFPEAIQIPVIVVRASDGKVLYSNATFQGLVGKSREEIDGHPLNDVLDCTTAFGTILTSLDSGSALTSAALLGNRSDGAPLSLEASMSRVVFPDETDAILITMKDIGDQERMLAELRKLAQFPEMNPGTVCRMNPAGVLVLANKAAKKLFGEENLVGKSWFEICPGITGDVWKRIFLTSKPVPIETEIGDVCMMFNHVRSENGDFVFAFGTDITDRKRAEQQLVEQSAKLAEVARFPDMNPGPVLRLDLEAEIILANKAAKIVFGKDLAGQCWKDLCPAIDEAVWSTILKAHEPVRLEANVGQRQYVFAHLPDHASDLVFVFGSDVTQQKQTERLLRQSEKMATLGTLAAGVAHELNNPAAATRRAAEQLQEVFERLQNATAALSRFAISEDGKERLQDLERRARDSARQTKRLDPLERSDLETEVEDWLDGHDIADAWELAPALVDLGLNGDVLDTMHPVFLDGALAAVLTWASCIHPVYSLLYEIGNGSARISEIVKALKGYSYLGQAPVQEINLHEGIDNTLVILRNKLKVGITVRRDYCDDLPLVPAYGSELNQVWTNLLDNAADAMNGKGEITIRTHNNDGWAIVEIEDNGPGIPPEIQSRIFDPFFTTKAPGKGTGLGLATTYSIITEKHKGQISLESQPGTTRFIVKLPLNTSITTEQNEMKSEHDMDTTNDERMES